MFRRRRPLMRAAVAGGGAHVAGKRVARRSAAQGQENEQDERLATLEERALALHGQGALTDDEFATAKARLIGG